MTATVRALRVMDACVAQRDADGAVRAYSDIVNLDQRCRPDAMAPRDHVVWLYNLNHGCGVHILERECLARCLKGDSQTLAGVGESHIDPESFDHRLHIVLTSQPTVLSLMPEGHVPALGPGSRVAVVHIKQAVLWWERGT